MIINELALAELYETGRLLDATTAASMAHILKSRTASEIIAIRSQFGGGRSRYSRPSNGVAVIQVFGMITHRPTLLSEIFGGTSTEELSSHLDNALSDPYVKAIVFDIDSPGGDVDGVPEFAVEVYRSRGKKPIVAVANATAASAAYWIASAAGELVITPSGQVGSIGVFAAHRDISKALEMEGIHVTLISAGKFKTDLNPFEPLNDGARSHLQYQVDYFGSMFTNAVAKYRGVQASFVRQGMGQGRLVSANSAIYESMADRVATLDDTIARLAKKSGGIRGSSARSHNYLQIMQQITTRERELIM